MSPHGEPWRPVLTGEDAEQAARFIRKTVSQAVVDAPDGAGPGPDPFLANGALGQALLGHEAAAAGLAPEAAGAAEAYIRHCLAAVRAQPGPLGLYTGSAGLLWFLARRPAGTSRTAGDAGGLDETADSSPTGSDPNGPARRPTT